MSWNRMRRCSSSFRGGLAGWRAVLRPGRAGEDPHAFAVMPAEERTGPHVPGPRHRAEPDTARQRSARHLGLRRARHRERPQEGRIRRARARVGGLIDRKFGWLRPQSPLQKANRTQFLALSAWGMIPGTASFLATLLTGGNALVGFGVSFAMSLAMIPVNSVFSMLQTRKVERGKLGETTLDETVRRQDRTDQRVEVMEAALRAHGIAIPEVSAEKRARSTGPGNRDDPRRDRPEAKEPHTRGGG